MKVYEAQKIIENIEETIRSIHKITKLDSETDKVESILEEAEVGLIWKNIALHSVNAMCAYKNILEEQIKNAELSSRL